MHVTTDDGMSLLPKLPKIIGLGKLGKVQPCFRGAEREAYEGLYRSWSDVIHAGSGLNHVGPSDLTGTIVIRPIRHPEGLESACSLAAKICLNTARNLVQKYGPDQWEHFCQTYSEKISPMYMQVCKGNLINAPWR